MLNSNQKIAVMIRRLMAKNVIIANHVYLLPPISPELSLQFSPSIAHTLRLHFVCYTEVFQAIMC